MRIGKWKGVKLGWKVKTPQKLQLFDLEQDLGETNNIAAQHPDIVKRMEEIIQEAHQPLPANKSAISPRRRPPISHPRKPATKRQQRRVKKKLNSTPRQPTGKG